MLEPIETTGMTKDDVAGAARPGARPDRRRSRADEGLTVPRLFASDDDRDLVRAERDVRAAFTGLDLDLTSLAAVSNIFRAATAVRNHMEGGVLAEHELSGARSPACSCCACGARWTPARSPPRPASPPPR